MSYRCREGCNFSLAECQRSPRDVFPQKLSHLDGPNFLGVDAGFWDVALPSSNCFESFSFLPEHQVCVDQEAALFLQVSWRPLDCENVKIPKQPTRPGASMGDNLTCGGEALPVLVRPSSLIALCASFYLPPLQAIRAASEHSALVG